MRINTNTAAMNTYSNLTSANASKSGSLAKLSSGLRINKAGDDAAGLSISEKMKNQISGMTQASRNAQDGISLIQTAEGALTETHSMLNRMRDLTVQAGNGTNTVDDKKAIQGEIDSLSAEITRVSSDTEFNTQGLLNGDTELKAGIDAVVPATALAATHITDADGVAAMITAYNSTAETADKITPSATGTAADDLAADQTSILDKFDAASNAEKTVLLEAYNSGSAEAGDIDDITVHVGKDAVAAEKGTSFTFQIGANAGEKISVDIKDMSTKGLGISDIDVVEGNTDEILGKLDTAISSVSSQRADLGAVQNRLDHTVSNLATTKENLSEANSRIRDVDMAEEMMSFTKSNILSQASTAMLAQANQMPQGVLQLLG
ncbi:flagellin [Alkalibacterium sp. 20]|uniref:flagellin N-terminal helical domain-containing protein n=1 Tax=Alkalibacterium sp. 20 TaxID=1798803 RepID=UPI000900385F|nr:flagellin [Alkalibacterium sp. 20]OJF93935.1 flagellin [Alkalibacterium sp. 20]